MRRGKPAEGNVEILTVVSGLVVLGLGSLLAFADLRWRARSAGLIARLGQGNEAAGPSSFSATELAGLPVPVARYFRAVLREGQPVVRRARYSQRGQFLVRPGPNGWRPFEATQYVAAQPAGFVWDARIRVAPGLHIRVRDAFVEGAGSMLASFMGIGRMVSVEGTPEIAAGALHRYLAEAVLIPTALLPSRGVVWAPIDDSSARATLSVSRTTVSLDFHFGADGLVESVFTPARARDVEGRAVPTPWRGRWQRYEERHGMRVPLAGEVEWVLPEGPQTYWRGRISDAEYWP